MVKLIGGWTISALADALEPYILQKISNSPASIPAGSDDDAIHDNVSGEIQAIAEKSTPADADLVIIEDSAASYAKKKVQVGNIGGGVSESGWTDYSSSSTVNGWTSFTTKEIFYKTIGDLVVFQFVIQGVADGSAVANFTLPNGMDTNISEFNGWMRAAQSGSWIATGNWSLFDQGGGNTNTIELFPDAAQVSGWATSGNKYCVGQGWYIKA